MRKTFAFQLYNSQRLRHLHARIDLAAEVYNYFIAVIKRYYRLYKRYPGYHRLQNMLPKLKRRARYVHWKEVGSQVLQDIVRRIDQGYQRFFANIKARQAGLTTMIVRPPTFRKRHKYPSITFTQAGWKYHGGNLLTIGGRRYRFHPSRPIEGTIKTVTIKRLPTGRMTVIFSCVCDPESVVRTPADTEAGFDFGLVQFLTGSDGNDVTAPQPFKAALRRYGKPTGHCRGNRRARTSPAASQTLARVHRTIANRRTAWHWDTARDLCTLYDTIYLEDLNLQGMKAMWGRKVSDLGFASSSPSCTTRRRSWERRPPYRPVLSLDQTVSCLWHRQHVHHPA